MEFSFVTYSGLPDLDPDDRLVTTRLTEMGYTCEAVIWNDPAIDWASKNNCIIRSTWDYHLHHSAFAQWAQETTTKTRLFNDLSLLLWNMDKTYMQDLERHGVPIIPTTFFKAGQQADLLSVIETVGWNDGVIKPTIGLCTYGIKKFSRNQESLTAAQNHLDELLTSGDAMVQPYIPSVETYGERSLVFIEGQFTHAVRKTAFQPLAVAGQAGEQSAVARQEELNLAFKALSCLATPPLYARVDVVEGSNKQPLVIELELIEPSLFLSFSETSVQRLAEAIVARQ